MPKSKEAIAAEHRMAVEQRNLVLMQKKARQRAMELERKKRLAEAKREHERAKLKVEIARKKAEIRDYERRLEKAEELAKKPAYGLVAVATLVLFGITLAMTLIIYLLHGKTALFTVTQIIAFLLLSVSIFAQTIDLEGEEKAQDYTRKIRRAQNELRDLEHRRSM